MRILLFSIFTLALHLNLFSQSENATEWFINKEEAIQKATDENKNILMVFGGSDWCRPCMKLKKNVLEDSSFDNYAKEKYVVLYLDFPQRRKNKLSKEQTDHNESLAEKFNKTGSFPKVLLFDNNLETGHIVEYKSFDTQNFIDALETIN